MPGVSVIPAIATPETAQPISNLSNPNSADLEHNNIQMHLEEADQPPFAGADEQDARMHEVSDHVAMQADMDQHVDQKAKGMCSWQFIATPLKLLYQLRYRARLQHMQSPSKRLWALAAAVKGQLLLVRWFHEQWRFVFSRVLLCSWLQPLLKSRRRRVEQPLVDDLNKLQIR